MSAAGEGQRGSDVDAETATVRTAAGQGQRAGLHQHAAAVVQRDADSGSAGAGRLLERALVGEDTRWAAVLDDEPIAQEVPGGPGQVGDRSTVVDEQHEVDRKSGG